MSIEWQLPTANHVSVHHGGPSSPYTASLRHLSAPDKTIGRLNVYSIYLAGESCARDSSRSVAMLSD